MPKELTLNIHATPRSSRSVIEELEPRLLKVKLKSAPTGGQANRELIEILAKHYQIAKSYVEITKGLTSKIKTVKIYLP